MEGLKSFKSFITEAKVMSKDVDKTANTIIRYFNSKLGMDYSLVDTLNVLAGNYRLMQGLYKGKDGSAVGLNFQTSGEFMSIFYWRHLSLDGDGRWSQPDRMLTFADKSESFVKILPRAIEALVSDSAVDESTLNEVINTYKFQGKSYTGKRETALAMKQAGESDARIMQILDIPRAKLQKFLGGTRSADESEDGVFDIDAAPRQTVSDAPEVEAAVKTFEETEYADPSVVFDQLDTMVRSVGTGNNPALLITGQGGIGKSFGVGRVLKEVLHLVQGEDFVILKGSTSAFAMYRYIYNNYNKTIIFDDCDSVFDGKDSLNVLKGVLDSGMTRVVSWETAGTVPVKDGLTHQETEELMAEYSAAHGNKIAVPSQFEFEGSIIFISNMTKKQIEERDAALLTRCMSIDITLSLEDTINRIKTCLPFIKYYAAKKVDGHVVDITNEQDKIEVMEYMEGSEFHHILASRGKASVSFRTLINLCKLKASDPENWKRCAPLAI